MRAERARKAQKYWVALFFVLLGTFAGVWHNRRLEAGKPDYIAGLLRGIVSLPSRFVGGAVHGFAHRTEWITRSRRLADENQKLRIQVAELQGENNKLREAQINLDRLRDDLGFRKRSEHPMLAADVVALRPDAKYDTFIISRGSNDGVTVASVVVTRDGLVGRVIEVEPGTSVVLMLTDQKSGVGGRIQRPESRAVAVCEGDNSKTLTMVALPSGSDVKVGDTVVTSGLGGVYPAGILIGAVCEVSLDPSTGSKSVRVQPHVAYDTLEQVYVVVR